MTIAGHARTGLVLRDPFPWPQFREIVETAEDTGYESLFVPEISGREAFATLAAAATTTSRIGLGTGVITMWSRRPSVAAMGAATLQEVSDGRAILGIGAGTPPVGTATTGTHDRLASYVAVVRQAWSGSPVGDDPLFGDQGFALTLSLEPHGPPPLWLGALGDRSIRLGGRAADGVILNWCTPARVAEARGLVAEGAAEARRDPGDVTIAVYVRACLGVEEPVALEALRPMTGLYASFPHYRRQLGVMGLGAEADAAAAAVQAGKPDAVPDDLVRALTVFGGRSEAMARFERFRTAGADVVLCYPVVALDPLSSVLGTVLSAAPSPAVER
jgi:alkanesulfonate monooxygenase SsuD/methylene tetrahydromethanopterin reductase-like flavin-dependent oxidoreductase (luciferase family)